MNSFLALPFGEIIEQIRLSLPSDVTAYLVGGAVRDVILNRPNYDLDFVLTDQALQVGRRVANALGGAYFPLDEERQTARVILSRNDGKRQVLDFALLRDSEIESDLRKRDFTINAMAIRLGDDAEWLDPLGGNLDLRNRVLRTCSETALVEDPIRVMRAVRLASTYQLRILPETNALIRQAVGLLPRVSPERVRDELFRILEAPKPATSIRVLDMLAALPHILPELTPLKGVEQLEPHISDVWEHTLDVVSRLERIVAVLAEQQDLDASANWTYGYISALLGRYRTDISQSLNETIIIGRSRKALLYLAALYHDTGKPATYQVDDGGRIRFIGHESLSAEIISRRGNILRLSNQEIHWLKTIVKNHMRPLLLAQSGQPPCKRAKYRFFRQTGPAGVDICLHSLADTLATYGSALPEEAWSRTLQTVRALLEAWWEQRETNISPPPILRGKDLINEFGLTPGPMIGELLELVREAQATGEVTSPEQALNLARSHLESWDQQ